MHDIVRELMNSMVERATVFLSDANEFYPFGGVVRFDNTIIPLAAYSENNYPESLELMALLEKAIKVKFQSNEILLGAIAFDIDFKETTASKSVPAIQINLMKRDGPNDNHYFLYKRIDGRVNIYDYIIYKKN